MTRVLLLLLWEGCQLSYRLAVYSDTKNPTTLCQGRTEQTPVPGVLWSLVHWYSGNIKVDAMNLPKCRVPLLTHVHTFLSVGYIFRRIANLQTCRAPAISAKIPPEQIRTYASRTYPWVILCSTTVAEVCGVWVGHNSLVSTATNKSYGKGRQRLCQGCHGVT